MIPYRTLPTIDVGPIALRSFGFLVALGVLAALAVVADLARRHRLDEAEVRRLAVRLVVAGVVGARIAYVVSDWREMVARPWKVVALWEGGLQFFGGFVAAVVVLLVWLRSHPEVPRRRLGDVLAVGLATGMAIGRLGCVAVGEHLGAATDRWWGARFVGGSTIEPLTVGDVVLLPALYEALFLAAFALVARRLVARGVVPAGRVLGGFLATYGVTRFLLDTLRVNDDRLLGLTAAQAASGIVALAGLVILLRTPAGQSVLAAENYPVEESSSPGRGRSASDTSSVDQ